ncbi:MAG: leucyl aminopeptidase [Spirochaetes bacterium]|nr:leucyl aminopeptidase [Spirochaetota bacterium]
MKLLTKPAVYSFTRNDFVALFLSEEYEKDINYQIIPELSFVKDKTDLSSFKGKSSETMFIPFRNHPNVILIGMGKKNKITKESLRECAVSAVKLCKHKNIAKLSIVLPVVSGQDEHAVALSIAEGLILSDYTFDKYKSYKEEDDLPPQEIKEIKILCEHPDKTSGTIKETEIICSNTKLCRDLVNETSELSNPVAIAGKARSLTKLQGVTCKVHNRKEIEKLKMGLLLAVSRGSTLPPQFVVLKYNGNPGSKKQIAIVGKGITYDSGGMNLKPSSSIEDMRGDMAGAAACLFAVKSAAELKLKKNIAAVIPLCENMLSNNSYRSGDVFRAYNGNNVEIGNTDAEGRLILADAVAYTEKVLKPEYIIDVATLTGACLVCFGETIAAVLSTDDELADAVFNAGNETGEKVWRLPFDKTYDEMVKSDIADIKNIGSGRNAGTIVGATFIKNFIRNTKWAHIDIAGTAWYSKARGYNPKHATGFGVRLFIELFKSLNI